MIIDITNRYNSKTFVYGRGANLIYSTKESYSHADVEVAIIYPQVPEAYIIAEFDTRWLS